MDEGGARFPIMITFLSYIFTGVLFVGGFLGNLLIFLALVLTSAEDGVGTRNGSPLVNLMVGLTSGANLLLCGSSAGLYYENVAERFPYFLTSFEKFLAFLNNEGLFCTIWFTALLCLLYCLKILSCKHSLFLKVKQNIPKLVPFGIVSGLIMSTASSNVPFLFYCFKLNVTLNSSSSTASPVSYYNDNPMTWVFIGLFGLVWVSFPFGVCVISCVTVVSFLHQHLRNMKSNSSELSNCRLKSPKRVLLMISFQVLLYIMLLLESFASTLAFGVSQNLQNTSYMIIYPLYCLMASANIIIRNGSIRMNSFMKLYCYNKWVWKKA
uniref:Taste receptor type 2 n=1 Tax=Erpetoichthys calabaricus TaxID=27687 RepID=A0A8C4TH51_ERPCA